MSGIVGIFHRDGRRADPEHVKQLTQRLAHRGPDGLTSWCAGEVGLGHVALHTTPEAVQERQPLTDARTKRTLVWDGRLDNRDELLAALAVRGAAPLDTTDAGIVLAAFDQWGEEALARLLGDFALALWDGPLRRLLLARDILGLRPLCYHLGPRLCVWASELGPIVELAEVSREPQLGLVAELLSGSVYSERDTLFQEVQRLAPAHLLRVTAEASHSRRYWSVQPGREVRYRTDDQYAEHFFEVFGQAVACRLRSQRPVGVFLSGGIDSSAVSAMAWHLARARGASPPESYSLVFPGLSCDESPWIDAVVARLGLSSNRFAPPVPPLATLQAQVALYRDIPDYPNGSMSNPALEHARQQGARVLLTGLGGDEWFTGSRYHYADMLRRGQLAAFLRQLLSDTALREYPLDRSHPLLVCGIRPLLPEGLLTLWRTIRGRRAAAPAWIGQGLVAEGQLAERLQAGGEPAGFSSLAQGHLYAMATAGRQVHAFEMEERSASFHQLEQRHPLMDRRILELGLALPEAQRWRGPIKKVVMRRALRELLPPLVVDRTGKAEFSVVFLQQLRALTDERFFADLSLARRGWVRGARALALYREELGAKETSAVFASILGPWILWTIFGLELWARDNLL